MFAPLMAVVLLGAHFFYFVPPEGWLPARPQSVSTCVQIGFIGQGKTQFHPSLNLAIEETQASLKEYVRAVKAIHLAQVGTKWLDLGAFQMRAGAGRLIQLEISSPLGPQCVMQALFVQGGRAYILTGACLKEELLTFRSTFIDSFCSFTEIPDLLAPVDDLVHKEILQRCLGSLGRFPLEGDRTALQEEQWQELQALVAKVGVSLGGYWQFLVLQEGYQKIHAHDRS